jgi:hypothetical protein
VFFQIIAGNLIARVNQNDAVAVSTFCCESADDHGFFKYAHQLCKE